MKEKSMKKHFTAVILLSVAALLVVQACIVFVVYSMNRRMSQQYIEDNVMSAANNIEKYLAQIENMAYHISTNWSLISLYSHSQSANSEKSFENASQMVQFMCGYETSIISVVILDPDGGQVHFFGETRPELIKEIQPPSFYSDSRNLDRTFYFFDSSQPDYAEYFVYYAPVFDMSAASSAPLHKVATALFVCNKRELGRMLGFSDDGSAAYFIARMEDGTIVVKQGAQEGAPSLPGGFSQASAPLGGYGLTIAGYRSGSLFSGEDGQTGQVLAYASVLFVTIAFILLIVHYSLRKYVTLPFADLNYQLSHFNSGDLKGRIRQTGVEEIDYFVQSTNTMIENIQQITRKVFYTQDKLYESELRKTEAELYALQSQINPHFLYNTLQCIRGLASMKRCDEIKEISLAMAEVFKYSIRSGEYVRVLEEIKIIYKYLSIYRIRFDNAIDYSIDVPDALFECRTIKMIIQPTVENAILHGFEKTDIRPKIIISAMEVQGDILFRIIDNGQGMDYATLIRIRAQLEKPFSDSIKDSVPLGQGLYNINRRIKLTWGEQYGLTIMSNPNGTEVDILILLQPFDTDEEGKMCNNVL